MISNFTFYFPAKHIKMPDVYRYYKREHILLDLNQGNTTPVDSQQEHATSLEKHEGTSHSTSLKTKKTELPQFVIDHIKTFVFFVGFAHSGHSIVGSLLDSHPHMVISHELDLFTLLSQGMISPTKQDIFNAIWKNSQQTRIRAGNGKGYNLLVDGVYQGKYIDYIDVIGDKRGRATIDLLRSQPKKWSSAYDALKSLNLNLKVILVLRNPYDNIASTMLLNNYPEEFRDIKRLNITKRFSLDKINVNIEEYFRHHSAIVNAKRTYNLDMIEVHSKDLISDSRGTLLKLCDHVGVNCSNNYLEMCKNKIYKHESRTRRFIEWPDEQLRVIQQNTEKYNNLKGYSFNSP